MRNVCAIVLLLAVLTGCGHKKHARHVPPPPAPAPEAVQPGYTETGIASWYGHPYHGRAAADGEIYDMETMVAAHRTLPFNTVVRVVNQTNQKTVDLRIIDRGPFVDGRIIDVSHAAARALAMIGPGTAPVTMEVLTVPAVAPGEYAVQVGSFRNRENAERLRAGMAVRYGSARIVPRQGNPGMWRVLVGSESTEDGAQALSNRIQRESGEKNLFVVRLDS